MKIHRGAIVLIASVGVTGTLGSQQLAPCPTEPGVAFGITGYRCASCGVDRVAGMTVYNFQSEPIVTQADSLSEFQAGDVIVAINGKPVTTREGSALLVHPPGGHDATYHLRVGDSLVVFEVPGPGDEVNSVRSVRADGTVLVGYQRHVSVPVLGLTLDAARAAVRAAYAASGASTSVDLIDLAAVESIAIRRDGRPWLLSVSAKHPCRAAPAPGRSAIADTANSPLRAPRSLIDPSQPFGLDVRQFLQPQVPTPINASQPIGFVRRHMLPIPRDTSAFDPVFDFQVERQTPPGVRYLPPSAPGAERQGFGFAVECVAPSCTVATAPDGPYWRFTAPPPIASVRDTSAAAAAGLRARDVLIAVDGQSILADDGALAFERAVARGKQSIRVSVIRDGRQIDLTLVLTR